MHVGIIFHHCGLPTWKLLTNMQMDMPYYLFYRNVNIKEMDNNIKELEDNPKIITKFEPLIWLAFIALTAVVGCPIF